MRALERLLKTDSLTEAKVRLASFAASGLYAWINAVRTYFFVYRDSASIRDKLMLADLQLKKLQENRNDVCTELKGLQQELINMR